MTEIETEIVIDHFEETLAHYIHNSETCCNNGLLKIYGNKARWLSQLLRLAKKQISEPPCQEKANLTDFVDFYCPACRNKIISRLDGEWIAGRKQKYCDNCGQALEWEELL